MNNQTTGRRWNLFARELEDLLLSRQLGLGHLDDRAGIHREKVRRLRRSLQVPKSLPVLNPEEMDAVIYAFELREEEVLRLHAALLATAIEEMLIDRIDQEAALQAAEQILPVIVQTLQENTLLAMRAIRGRVLMPYESEASEIDQELEVALRAIEHATLALHLSRNGDALFERVEHARQARDNFALALHELEEAPEPMKATDAWKMWFAEAQKGVATAEKRLHSLGV